MHTPESTTAGVGASYARYSSDLQDDSSIDQQQRKCRDRAATDGVSILTEFEFADRAVSGTKRERDGLNALLAAARDRRFGVLYFESLSRLARESVITMPMLKELVYVHRVRVVSVSEGIDSAQANWDLLANFMSWVHEQYLKTLRAAVLRGQEEAVLNDWSAGDWCFGYASEPILGSERGRRGRRPRPRMRVVIDPLHAEWVRKVFHWFVAERWSVRRIARELTRLGVPKDHRATTPGWHHESVRRVLRNEKYVGIWGWGRATNVRNPLTGAIAQEGRSPEEVAKWVRHRPAHRIVEDDTFVRAQALLDQNEERWAATRTETGRLRGSTRAAGDPRHLLQGLVKCAACGATFQVSGANGKYLGCVGHTKGLCGVKTRLPRRAAEAKLLAAVADRVLGQPAWLAAVADEARRAWEERCRTTPDERAAVEAELAAVRQKIARLVDAVEAGGEVADRLRERRKEKTDLEARLARLGRPAAGAAAPPTREWVEGQVRALGEVLRAGGPDAAHALRRLVGGAVAVAEEGVAGRKRKHLVGTFTLPTAESVLADEAAAAAPPADGPVAPGEVVRVVFRADPPWADVADPVKAAFDRGTDYRGIAAAVGCPYPWVAKALAWWHRARGHAAPDGRALKGRLDRPTRAAALADAAKELWDADVPIQEIAARLGCNRDTATAAVRHWFASRGLPVPDGRHRRREVRLRRRE